MSISPPITNDKWDIFVNEKAFWFYLIIFYIVTILYMAYKAPKGDSDDFLDIVSESQYEVVVVLNIEK